MPVKCFQGISEITTKDGRTYQMRIDIPHGLGNDPLSDRELEDKFRAMALKYMKEQQIQKIFETLWNVERLDDIRKLMRLMIFE
jgi:2-methylcitrate dehydratase